MTLTAVPGIRVGHHTDRDAVTGVTVVALPEPNLAVADLRGAAPGTREVALLVVPGMRIGTIQAIVLSGGSAFGLASADGVVAALEAEGRGHPTPMGVVPIVPTAIIYDLMIGRSDVRPGPAEGAAALAAATTDPVPLGSVGAGTGATVAGWRGREAIRQGGVGSAAVPAGDGVVAALTVVNAVGDVFTLEGRPLTGGSPVPDWADAEPPTPMTATTLVVVATDLSLGRVELQRMAVRAHDALGACLRPGHTRYDGDAAFVVSCGEVAADADLAGEAAFRAVGEAIVAAIEAATPVGGIPAVGDTG
jgi:L-aminopeptidase/D-esterase-like protein